MSKVTRSAQSFQLEIEGKDKQEARAVVLAVAGNEGNRLLGGVGGWSVPEVRAWNQTTAFCYAAQQAPVNEPIILLNGEGRAAGPVNNVAVMSAVSPQYAPPGAHLVVASVVGEAPAEDAALVAPGPGRPATYEEVVRPSGGFMEDARGLHAGPRAAAAASCRVGASPVRVGGTGGVYMCGDYRETASIQGALASGRRAAEAVIKDLRGI